MTVVWTGSLLGIHSMRKLDLCRSVHDMSALTWVKFAQYAAAVLPSWGSVTSQQVDVLVTVQFWPRFLLLLLLHVVYTYSPSSTSSPGCFERLPGSCFQGFSEGRWRNDPPFAQSYWDMSVNYLWLCVIEKVRKLRLLIFSVKADVSTGKGKPRYTTFSSSG